MPNSIEDIIARFINDKTEFTNLVINTETALQDFAVDEDTAATLRNIASRSRSLAMFTPKTLGELAADLSNFPVSGQPGFDPTVAAFTDNFSDSYTDNYSNSDARISIDSWTRDLVLNGGLDLSQVPGGGFD